MEGGFTYTWPPGPLLRPLLPDTNPLLELRCTPSWPSNNLTGSDELEQTVKYVQVHSSHFTFLDGDRCPVFIKRFMYMDGARALRRGPAGQQVLVTVPKRPNVSGDIEFDVSFESPTDCALFCQVSERQLVPPPEVHAKVYILEEAPEGSPEWTAFLLAGFPVLRDLVNGVFTSLAYSQRAEVLAPIVDWNTLPRTPEQMQEVRDTIQTRFRTRPPPPILILTGAATQSEVPLPEFLTWDDAVERSRSFPGTLTLPSPPRWTSHATPPESWVNLSVPNYGIHTRNSDTSVPYIALSYELVDHLAAACSACARQDISKNEGDSARLSLQAAVASVKLTLVHEIAHLWISEQGKSSPPRAEVRGANDSSFDVAEDSQNPGTIEAGLLVERCWLGSPHELATTNAGWLALALRENSATRPPIFTLHSDHDDDSDSNSSEDDHPLGTMRLGSPIRLPERSLSPMSESSGSGSSVPADDNDDDVLLSVRVCDITVAAQFVSSGLPPLSSSEMTELQARTVSRLVTPTLRRRSGLQSPGQGTPRRPSTPLTTDAAGVSTPQRPMQAMGGRSVVATTGPSIFLETTAPPLIFQILGLASPHDVVQWSKTCRGIRAAIFQSEPHVWDLARERVCHLPPPPAVSASGNWGEGAYAQFIFGEGCCFICGETTSALPGCFALGLRCCEGDCRRSCSQLPDITHWTAMFAALAGSYAAVGVDRWIPPSYLSGTNGRFVLPSIVTVCHQELQQAKQMDAHGELGSNPRFVRRTMKGLAEECTRRKDSWPVIQASHDTFTDWEIRYRAIKVEFDRTNLHRVAAFAHEVKINIGTLLKSPTLQRTLKAYSRDLAPIYPASLQIVKARILQEILLLKDHETTYNRTVGKAQDRKTLPANPSSSLERHEIKVACPVCRLLFYGDEAKIFNAHWAEHGRNEKPTCLKCGPQKTFDFQGLVSHCLAK
ncbi:hypothetical protein DFH06DRAFT_1430000 [Mycena polygramma]|nr:hypothetical protein DFH06DRAFT_1430000 [Mycena polygramma]